MNIPDRSANSHEGVRSPNDGLGPIEVFWINSKSALEPGWYWWNCHPGCLPDSDDPVGPFKTSTEAYEDATMFGDFG